jgi:predicted lysophospholipase L1 biosynthesis ABC-type transport system permease subunit
LDAINTLYLILILGSLAFGLEALSLGLGGRLMVLYRRRRVRALALALGVGLAVVGPAIATSAALSLGPIYLCVLVLVYMFVASRIIAVFGAKLAQTPPQPIPPQPSDMEVAEMLRKRGYGRLVKKKRKTR